MSAYQPITSTARSLGLVNSITSALRNTTGVFVLKQKIMIQVTNRFHKLREIGFDAIYKVDIFGKCLINSIVRMAVFNVAFIDMDDSIVVAVQRAIEPSEE